MPGVGLNTSIAFVPPGGVDYMRNEVAPEYIFDQDLNYPAANNYGYDCTGFELPGEWGDHHRIFALDGQDLHCTGMQTYNLPSVYYMPSYGYVQMPHNQYNPYIPGAVIGIDGPFIGSQQFFSSPYHTPVSSPAYIPVLVHPTSDFVPMSSSDLLFFSSVASIASRPVTAGTQSSPLQASISAADSSQTAALGRPAPASEPYHPSHWKTTTKPLEGPKLNIPQSDQPLWQDFMMHGSASTTNQIPYNSAMNMLKNFKSSPLRMSIRDDFTFYEEQQKVMHEKKHGHLGRSFSGSPFVPLFVPASEPTGTGEHLLKAGEKQSVTDQSSKAVNEEPGSAAGQPPTANERQTNGVVTRPPNGKQLGIAIDQLPKAVGKQSSKANGRYLGDASNQHLEVGTIQPCSAVSQPSKADEEQLNTIVDQHVNVDRRQLSVAVDQPPKGDGRKQSCTVHLPPKEDGTRSGVDQLSTPDGSTKTKDAKSSGELGPSSGQLTAKLGSSKSSHDSTSAKPDEAGDTKGVNPVMKIGLLSINPRNGDSRSSRVVAAEATPTEVVNIGSVQIKVKGFGESSSRFPSVGAVAIEPKGLKVNMQGSMADSHPPKKLN